MLSPEEIEAMSEALIQIYIKIEDDLLNNVASRFSVIDEIAPETIAEWQTSKLMELGALRRQNISVLAKNSGKTTQEVQHILNEAGFKTLQHDERVYKAAFSEGLLPYAPVPVTESLALQQILLGALSNTRRYLNTVNTTALQSAEQGFLDIINQVYLETSLGITDYNTATRKAVRNLADQGITGADYVSAAGRRTRNHIDVAVRRCIVTSTAQTAGKMQEQRAKEWGNNLVEVSSHLDARPSHAVWQGRIYSLEGETDKYPNLARVTGYGTVTGLMGANCRHVFYPFVEGLSEQTYKPYDLEESAKAYEKSQEQRKFERDIRQQKRRILAADAVGDKEGKLAAQLKLKEKEATLKQFIKDTGRTQRTNRQQVLGFGHSQASQAVWAQRKAPLPKTVKASDTILQASLGDSRVKGIIPQGAGIGSVRVIAGAGTSSELRAVNKLAEKYGGEASQWQKKGGIITSNSFRYDMHWYELAGRQYEIKLKGVKSR